MSRVVTQKKFLNKISSTTVKPQIILDSKYAALNLKFQQMNFNGHMGARKFWHEYLPTVQFYNPSLPINVTRIKNEDKKIDVPCVLQAAGPDGKVLTEIDMKNKLSADIMDELLQKLEHQRVQEEEIIKA